MTSSCLPGSPSRHILDRLRAVGVGSGDTVLVHVEDERDRRILVDAVGFADAAAAVPTTPLEDRFVDRICTAVNADVILTDRPLECSRFVEQIVVERRSDRLNTRCLDTRDDQNSSHGHPLSSNGSGRHWILRTLRDCEAWAWLHVPITWHAIPGSLEDAPDEQWKWKSEIE
ncbi:hypothetical protein ACFVKB_03330 [Rhodococcus sp. NPDC127530]|uniref:hypothetical protein n=1 Tax=unclassified Rhodococcus (in: high G+C Gram-positive bacteria) TaxID=192944 RepID=UPI0036271688